MFEVDQRVILRLPGEGTVGGRILERHSGVIADPPELGLPDIGWKHPPVVQPTRDRAGYYMVRLNREEPARGKPHVIFAHATELTPVDFDEPAGV